MFALGGLYTYLCGYFLSTWRTVAWLQLAPCLLLGLYMFFIPDSPYWLVERGREEEARSSLRRLRGPTYDVEQELGEMVAKKRKKEATGRSVVGTLCSRLFILPFIRIGTLMMITQWAGINVITAYMVTIFTHAGSSLDPDLAPILVSVIQQGVAMLSTGVLSVCPRKPLFLVCATLMAGAQCTMATYHYIVSPVEGEENEFGWVPVLAVILLNSFRTIGYMTVVQLLLAESFPTEIRSYASGICGACTAVNMFGATKLYPWFLDNLTFPGTFWLYTGVMAFQVVTDYQDYCSLNHHHHDHHLGDLRSHQPAGEQGGQPGEDGGQADQPGRGDEPRRAGGGRQTVIGQKGKINNDTNFPSQLFQQTWL